MLGNRDDVDSRLVARNPTEKHTSSTPTQHLFVVRKATEKHTSSNSALRRSTLWKQRRRRHLYVVRKETEKHEARADLMICTLKHIFTHTLFLNNMLDLHRHHHHSRCIFTGAIVIHIHLTSSAIIIYASHHYDHALFIAKEFIVIFHGQP